MKIQEEEVRPNPQGRGWVRFHRVRTLPEGESTPSGASIVADDATEHDWQTAPSAQKFAGSPRENS